VSRIPVTKTLKLYVNGQFPRSESGRTLAIPGSNGGTVHIARASRKDVRDAVGAARSAQPKWAGKTAYNRGQILYRLAEMIEDRAATLPTSLADAHAAADRAVHHAGWTDKVAALLSTLNPVAATYVNYSLVRPMGIIVAVPDPRDGLLGLVEACCGPLLMGDSVIVLASADNAEAAVALGECWALSDLPGGVVNLLTGDLTELLQACSRHDDIDGMWISEAVGSALQQDADAEAARVIRRVARMGPAAQAAGPFELQRLAEVQTVWMSAYEPVGGAASY